MTVLTDAALVFRQIERVKLATFDYLKRACAGRMAPSEISDALTMLESEGRIAILLGKGASVYYASQALLEESR